MTDLPEVPTGTPVSGPTEQELLVQLQAALDGKQFKDVAKVSAQLVKFQNARESAELTAKQAELAKITEAVKSRIAKAIQPMYDKGELDKADGVWFTWDFGEKLFTCRLVKSQAKAKGERKSGGGGGKKYPGTAPGSELWERHKNDAYKESGMTVEAAHNSNTDKNWRYAVHQFILKAEGLI